MDASALFERQLGANTEAFVWAVGQVPAGRLFAAPPRLQGEWPAARQAFHLLYYEREVALPSTRLWADGAYPTFEGYNDQAALDAWDHNIEHVLAEFARVREGQLAVFRGADEAAWQEERDTTWGRRTLYWVASKTLQHALEHTNAVLKT
ncbi:MAG TPA: DinB family protein, partial [Chloroflexia bacterium]|nr:DinB family protein [Chloroflexia bacterium]